MMNEQSQYPIFTIPQNLSQLAGKLLHKSTAQSIVLYSIFFQL